MDLPIQVNEISSSTGQSVSLKIIFLCLTIKNLKGFTRTNREIRKNKFPGSL